MIADWQLGWENKIYLKETKSDKAADDNETGYQEERNKEFRKKITKNKGEN